MEEIVQIISTLGFPIAVAVFLLFRDDKKDSQHREDGEKWSQVITANTEVIRNQTESINRNTGVIESLQRMLERMGDK